MAGDVLKASLWGEGDVFVATSLTAADPVSPAAFATPDYGLVGLLDGDDGFEIERDQDTNDFFAWGGILVRTSRKNFKLTLKFTALEDNDITRKLIWPGSPAGQIIVPKPANIKMGFEAREGKKVHRLITKNFAQVDLDGSIKMGESDLTKYPLVATIFPTGDGVLFTEQNFEIA